MLAVTQNASAADDLVQDVAMTMSIASESFLPGTNLAGWAHRIRLNHFIPSIHKQRNPSTTVTGRTRHLAPLTCLA